MITNSAGTRPRRAKRNSRVRPLTATSRHGKRSSSNSALSAYHLSSRLGRTLERTPDCTLTAVTAVRVLVTGSAGHLGEALVRVLRDRGYDVTGIDIRQSPCTTVVGSIADRAVVRACVAGADAVLHAATLHLSLIHI